MLDYCQDERILHATYLLPQPLLQDLGFIAVKEEHRMKRIEVLEVHDEMGRDGGDGLKETCMVFIGIGLVFIYLFFWTHFNFPLVKCLKVKVKVKVIGFVHMLLLLTPSPHSTPMGVL